MEVNVIDKSLINSGLRNNVNGSAVKNLSFTKNVKSTTDYMFFEKQVQKLLGHYSPAPASADENIGISLRSGLIGLNSAAIVCKINPTDSVIPI